MNLKDLEYKYGLSKSAITFIVIFCSFVLWCVDTCLLLLPRDRRPEKRRVLVIKLDAFNSS